MIICSYYTEGTPYIDEAQKLAESCRKLNLKCDIAALPDKGSWDLNTKYKPEVILNCMKAYQDSVLFVDADATFHARINPVVFGGDIAAYVMNKAFWGQSTAQRKFSLMSGTLYFPNTNKARQILSGWGHVNSMNPQRWDQRNLELVLGFNADTGMLDSTAYELCQLPYAYCCIDKTMPNVDYAVIRHHQASRKYKVIGRNNQ